ncbi:bifunctional 2-polyprenyl-6-hydroxyphenol methylase/3-demethylubiquinol 3-O-methyltransferase UbiG [Undibacterium sp.]|uniref:class I SAM-dependent methyltransferase n=1 Tax=Undibacterium sp. TaxID=1914977 RepID=UPI0027319217|nr:class I SAM-dependent methyltransferase [Undibacterium sp.]MDP1980818.1 class I SAM-dependent methyltransferase [Undibacterium sp.]
MAIKNKSQPEAQQLADKASLIQRSRRNAVPQKLVLEQENLPADNAIETISLQETMPEKHNAEENNGLAVPVNSSQPAAPVGLRQKIRRIPGLGYALAWCNALLRLPRTRFQTEVDIAKLQSQIDELNRQLVSQAHHHQELKQRFAQFESLKLQQRMDQFDALDVGNRLMQFDRLHIARQLRSVNLMMRAGLQTASVQNTGAVPAIAVEVKDVNSSEMSDLTPVRKAAAAELSASDFDQDQFYLEFEALFRGSREDIKQRLQVYLPYLSHISSQPKEERKMVIDVGCGRGEWLDLLDEQGIPAMGVDMNISMVNACLDQGFLVRHADAIAYLREQPAGSIGAVTGFQIIEHLPFEQLIALFDAAHHALCPGGVIIFETPNPENLKVGSCNFYFDPTHLHPIVPQVAEFMARQRGFSHAEILRLHPYPDDHMLAGGSEVEALLNKELFGPQDYAVIGRK